MQLTCKTISFIWTDQCQKAFETLEEALMKNPILVYPDPNKSYTLFMDASKYAESVVLTQEHATDIDGKTLLHQHPIAPVCGLFQGSQFNLAALTKEP